MLLLSSAQCRDLDSIAISGIGISEDALMESAGQAVAVAMEREWGELQGRRVVVLCGKGRNGGDGMVTARHLLNSGASVIILVAEAAEALSGPTRRQAGILEALGLKLTFIQGEESLPLCKAVFQSADYIVDALYGTGFKGAVTGLPAALLISMNAAGRPVVSIDLPSGLDADTGAVRGACAYAALTVSFSLPKLGLALQPGKSFAGKLVSADIGIPLALLARVAGPFAELSDAARMRGLLPRRKLSAHKKNAGTLLVLAGSKQYAGAAQLVAQAAFASGAAFVHVLVPEVLIPQMQAALPEAVVHSANLATALELAGQAHALVIGPGLGRSKEALALARALYEKVQIPAVIDADGLFAMAEGGFAKAGGPRLLTPHEGEFLRLNGATAEALEKDRVSALKDFVKQRACTTLLKGPATLVASPDGSMSVNSTGNAALATAGSGDVLSGIAGAFLAQGLGVFDAGRLAAFVHGMAADLWVREHGMFGLSASGLTGMVIEAFSHLGGKHE